ncbi:hypothetical protein N7G274_007143 [Stereocaulon virgatum]|uniref:amidase n=1 Tax=Stereocaulon virgatum TaxID=373712 RepID=A0ABR4A482_9LECA
MSELNWQKIAKIAQEHRDASIRHVEPSVPEVPVQLPFDRTQIPKYLLTPEEVLITETQPEDLIVSLAAGKFTSITVTSAFLRRAGLAQALTNCLTELLPERAIARAKFLDEYFKEHGKPIGPLHGIPISVKEHFAMKGLTLNAGFVSWWDKKGEDDAHVLKILWNAGCVFYARTTEPQSLMHLETSSNLYGATTNPFNSRLTSGGSSGGEGALIGMRGSCLGLGTDIGGSIRSPAANCGVYGLRPTSYRIPTEGLSATMNGQEQIVPVLGPLSTSLDGVKLFMKTVIGAKPWLREPSLIPFPWRDQESWFRASSSSEIIRIAVMWDDRVVRPHPPITRALLEVVEKLKEVERVELLEWEPHAHDEAWEIVSSLYFCDGAREESDAIEASGEPWRPLSTFIIKDNPNVKKLSVDEIWYWTQRREAYRRAYAKIWNETGTRVGDTGDLQGMVDVILCPVGPGAAPPLDCARYWGYTSQWNVLDYPALVFPVTKVDLEVDKVDNGYKPMNDKDRYNHELWQSGPEKYKDAPVSLQLVGRRYEDEKVVEALDIIKDRIGLPFANFV